MKDTLIINSISKIYFSIVSLFIFIMLTLSVTFLLLSSGINLKNIQFDSLRINKLYIKWDEKLNINIKEINILQNNSSKNSDLSKDGFFYLIGASQLFLKLTDSITIEKITKNDLSGNFIFDNGTGHLFLSSENKTVDSHIYCGDRFTTLKLNKFQDTNASIKADAELIIDNKKKSVYLDSQVDIANDISVNIFAKSDKSRLNYAFRSNKDIKDMGEIVSLFGIGPKAGYWIDTAIDMDYLTLNQAYGFVEYKNSAEALKNFYAYGRANELKYTYDQNLDSIQTKYTDLIFKDGVLFILPNDSTTYGMDLGNSWLRIDFTKPKEILTLHLLFQGMINKKLKHILHYYKIDLPFTQNSGYMDADYILTINLIDANVDAKGEFYTDKANITYLGLDLNLNNTLVKLDNLDAEISTMSAAYKDIAKADVYAKFDLKNDKGLLEFNFNSMSLGNNLNLDTDKNNLKAQYIISPEQDRITIDKSTWSLNNEKINVGSLDIPFNYEKLIGTIPTTELTMGNSLISYISGNINLKDINVGLDIDVVKFEKENIKLAQSVASFKGSYKNDKIAIESNSTIELEASDQDIEIDGLNLSYKDGSIHAKSKNIKVKNLLSTAFKVIYSLDDNDGYLRLNKLNFENDALGMILKKYNNINFKINYLDDKFVANSSSMGISSSISPKGWILSFNSLDKVKKYSDFLKKYQVDKGSFSIFKQINDKNIKFLADIDYKYNLLHIDDNPVSKYIIKGDIKDKSTNLLINDKVHLNFSDGEISIMGSDVGVDINNIVKVINNEKDQDKNSSDPYVTGSFKNSYIFLSKKRRILGDTIELQHINKVTSAQIKYAKGEAGLKYKDKKFHIYGSGFGDIFMENLFSMSKFKDGQLEFSVHGDIDKFKGVVFIKNTTIKRFRLLNNVLAFINTIPSLVTFSLPSYNTKGLYAKRAYMRFSYADSLYDISDVYLESDEMSILGHGKTSIKENFIDMELNLKTDLASSASKIPVVGYILFDKDSISTSIEIKGTLDDPKINSRLAEEIIVAPLNIIKRTLLLPFTPFLND